LTTSSPRPTLSLVVPVYKNAASIPALLDAIAGIARRVPGELEAVFVVDGSPDDSHPLLTRLLPDAPFRSVLVELSRNFGSFGAIRQGLLVASGDQFAVMAADLQEPPELIEEFFKILVSGAADVVLGERVGRADPRMTRASSDLYWRSYRRLVQKEMPPGGVDVFGCNKAVRDALLSMNESHSSLVGLLVWSGFQRATVPYERREREHGKSSWTFRKRVSYMLDSAFSFTDLPIRILLVSGFVGIALMLLASIAVLFGWFLDVIEVPGYTPLILAVLNSAALVVFSLGILGSYLWRTYENTKGRPLVLVRSVVLFGGRDDA
jgi:glycosyltransferase involved in cell wall biosynthesis